MTNQPMMNRSMTDQVQSDEPIRPQLATEAQVGINSPHWSFEPYWIGERLLARVADDEVRLTDASGLPVDDFYRDLADILRTSVDAEEAVLDGIWTAQPFLGHGSAAERWSEALADEAGDLPEEGPDPATLETRRAYVVVDLVQLDGQFLGDLPYQERRRLLSGLISESVRLRVTPSVKMPLASWFHAWQENGFSRAVAKHANSRYVPGTANEDWIVIKIDPDRHPGVAGLFWKGRKKREITR
jgi:bifunctional non-homologous end joining protein LigD